ncbi:nucleotide exchange factor GrpE [Dehalobacterium formicoaceticum]|uniref:Nucleotide exchange factor GrpE n=1 Tax=Dehalobacterium formicoaceticum TaxID=51515 RepID=A0ABT1Y040_9FIRM|nr:nucleotide exchange factor GrpE [Dehalobacterium formicoaceticum]MCR6544233.1 nucleotide exchange factor GrpE [Dehalobacterium formicoaceticum]
MGWRFWENKKKVDEEHTLVSLKEEISQIIRKSDKVEEDLKKIENKIDNKLEGINHQLENNEEAIQKSLRLEYKSSQEILKKLNQVNERITESIDYCEKYLEFEREKDSFFKERNFILERIIQWLDDIDLICEKIDGHEQEYWLQVLKSWQKQIVESLKMLSIYEIDILGKTFNHEVAESVGTKKREINKDYLPYEVVNVLQRGFILQDGTLLRKAKVITIEEKERTGAYEQ